MELVNAACNFEPHESFFSLFSDPRSTRLTRIHLREDLVQDQDLEAIRKQVRPTSPASGDGHGEAGRRASVTPPRQESSTPAPCTHPS